MKVTIESTARIVELNGVPARIWEGASESGVPVLLFVTRVQPQTNRDVALAAFEADLREVRPPSAAVEAIPLRLIL